MSTPSSDRRPGLTGRMAGLAVLVLSVFAVSSVSRAGELRLTTLEWPPYTGEGIPGYGAASVVLRQAAELSGDTLGLSFYPWQRTVRLGLEDPGYVGYFPEYLSGNLAGKCLFSKPIGYGPLGFAQRKDRGVVWKTLDDLSGVRIGTVSGYVNTADFDARVAAGRLMTDPAIDDVSNLRKVIAKRIPVSVVDRNVMQYLLRTDSSLIAQGGILEFNARLLEDKSLHVCFRKTPDGEAARARLDAALGALDVRAELEKALGF